MAKGKNGESVSELDQERGRETTTQHGGRRDRSVAREALSNAVLEIGGRLETLESSMSDFDTQVTDGLEGVKLAVADLEFRFTELDGFWRENVQTVLTLQDVIKGMNTRFESLEGDMALCKRAIANGGNAVQPGPGRVDFPKPSRFNGVRDAKEVENFLWEMEQYFENLNLMEEKAKIKTGASYLADTAMLWWRRKHNDVERGTCRLETWEDFKRELKRHFYPENVVYEARKKLRELRQKGPMREYVKEFTTLMLQIPNMTDENLVFYFTDGLQNWARQELQRKGVQSVDEAIAVAESLIDFRPTSPPESSRRREEVEIRGGGERREFNSPQYPRGNERNPRYEESVGKRTTSPEKREFNRPQYPRGKERNPRYGESDGKEKTFAPRGGCFVCKGPHPMKDCPKLGSLSAIMGSHTTEAHDEGIGQINSFQFLNVLKAGPLPKTEKKGLMYVEARINGKQTKVLVDTGATHNFMATDEAVRLQIKWSKKEGWVKTVNAKAQPVNGTAQGVVMQLGSWSGPIDFSIVPMDDFKVVLGLDFMRQAMAFPMPALSSICILEKGSQCMIPTIEDLGEGPKRLSAMQLSKGVKEEEPMVFAMLKVEDGSKSETSTLASIEAVLKENKDAMSAKLPKTLPLRRELLATRKLRPYRKRVKKWADVKRRPSEHSVGTPIITTSYEREVKEVPTATEARKRGVPRRKHYLIKWKGLPESEATWEAENDWWQFQDRLKYIHGNEDVPELGGGECHGLFSRETLDRDKTEEVPLEPEESIVPLTSEEALDLSKRQLSFRRGNCPLD